MNQVDTPPSMMDSRRSVAYLEPFVSSSGLSRSDSLVALSSRSFQAQLSRLTTLSLPPLSSLEDTSGIEALCTVEQATKDITRWIASALVVVEGLDAADDIEWSSGCRDALPELENSMKRFNGVIASYKELVDKITKRSDIGESAKTDSRKNQEMVSVNWAQIATLIEILREQAIYTREYRDCTTSLDEIAHELQDLKTQIYLVEERRHIYEPPENVDVDTLAIILQDLPEGENTGTPNKVERKDDLSKWDRAHSESVLRLTSKYGTLTSDRADPSESSH